MTPEPHEKRCETCDFNPSWKGNDFDSCPLWTILNDTYDDEVRDYKISLLGSFLVTTKYTGCFCHSASRTPAAGTQEGYIITEEQLVDLLSFADVHDYLWTKRTEASIRSRPASTSEQRQYEFCNFWNMLLMEPIEKHDDKIRHDEREKVLEPLKAVSERFGHLDKVLSDPEWCDGGEGSAIYSIAGEMWRAIKEALRQQQKGGE